jgi:hypothetical protein
LRTLTVVGAVVALLFVGIFFWFDQRVTQADEVADQSCRDEQIKLSIERNTGAIVDLTFRDDDLVIEMDWRRWIAMSNTRKTDIGMWAWCVQSLKSTTGTVLLMNNGDEIARVENGVWKEP